MSTLQMLRVFLNERLTVAAVEIFGAVEKTVVEYQEENDRLRRLLRTAPDIKLCREESLRLSVAVTENEVPPKQQEWRTSLQQEDLEPTQIKEEQEELWTCQEEEQLQEQECVKSKCDQENPIQSFSLPQTQTVENRDSNSKPVDLPHFVTVTHLEGLDIPCDPPDNQNNAYSHSSTVSSDPVGLDSSQPLNSNPSMREYCSKPSTTSRKTHRCFDCGEIFALTADLQGHVTLAKKRPSECRLCKKHYNSTCKLKAHVRLCHVEKPCTCPFCGKTFKLKGHLSRHMRIHTGEKPFSCADCGKSFIQKGDLRRHVLTHTGEKPFSCGDCGKSFNRKGNLNLHMLTHTGVNVHKERNK
ncbi:zinc finger protein 568-like [Salvelinus fontinalis]|uniref:zinc finger protein 568-like n=1 Tax=Salvelinus fontinalis TaxID=8038 RepID=UPI0024857556|nr:zinc finger protein 568-like [Salvelinus fontinalis]